MLSTEKKDITGLVKEIGCPLKALSIEQGQAYCNAEIKIGGETINKTCLGNIKEEIQSACAGCQIKNLSKAKGEIKLLEVKEGCVGCPAMNVEVDIESTCLTCVYFSKEEFKKKAASDGKEVKIPKIPCLYPNFPKQKIKEFIAKKKAAGAS